MNELQTINEHTIIRETSGYDLIKAVPTEDLPEVMRFLEIVYNYEKMELLI